MFTLHYVSVQLLTLLALLHQFSPINLCRVRVIVHLVIFIHLFLFYFCIWNFNIDDFNYSLYCLPFLQSVTGYSRQICILCEHWWLHSLRIWIYLNTVGRLIGLIYHDITGKILCGSCKLSCIGISWLSGLIFIVFYQILIFFLSFYISYSTSISPSCILFWTLLCPVSLLPYWPRQKSTVIIYWKQCGFPIIIRRLIATVLLVYRNRFRNGIRIRRNWDILYLTPRCRHFLCCT